MWLRDILREKKLLFSWISSNLTCINVHFVAKMLQSRVVLSAFSLLSPFFTKSWVPLHIHKLGGPHLFCSQCEYALG